MTTDDSSPLVPSPKSNEIKSSSWDFDQLQNEDELDHSNDFFSVLKKNIAKNVYFDEEIKRDSKKTIERSTVRVDSSDLISRCKHFLPLLTDANRNLLSKINSGENVRIEIDSDEDNEERTIEMNLMFCPNMDSSSSSSSSESDDDEPIQPRFLQMNKKNSAVNIVEIESTNKSEENVIHN